MNEELISELVNWKEAGFNAPVRIFYISELRKSGKPFKSSDVDSHGPTYHGSLASAKAAIRKENSIRSTPKFKWKDH